MGRDNDTTIRLGSVERYIAPKVSIRLIYDGHRGIVNNHERIMDKKPLEIGRAVDDDSIKVLDPSVSRKHARIVPQTGGTKVELEDTSSNGSFVNGQRVNKLDLHDGDIIRVGNSFLLVRYRPARLEDAEIPALVGSSPAIGNLRRNITIAAPSEATILVCGESGTGKELVARSVHEFSGRKGPFVPVNCAAIPSTLAESQLFGHIAGSFTGAKENHDGFFRQSHKGTLFLDEVGELPPEIQPKLLRVLEDSQVTPVGGVTPIPIDLRIVAATNRDLENAIETKIFRGDLFARLAELTIVTPPLRKRREDILPLLQLGFGKKTLNMDPDLVEMLLLHPWRFNVRELFKVATELRIQSDYTDRLELSHVQHRLQHNLTATPDVPSNIGAPREGVTPPPTPERQPTQPIREKEPIPTRDSVEKALRESSGNISELSRLMGKSRRQIYRYLKMYELDPDEFRTP